MFANPNQRPMKGGGPDLSTNKQGDKLRAYCYTLPHRQVKLTLDNQGAAFFHRLETPLPILAKVWDVHEGKVIEKPYTILELWPKCFFTLEKRGKPWWTIIEWKLSGENTHR